MLTEETVIMDGLNLLAIRHTNRFAESLPRVAIIMSASWLSMAYWMVFGLVPSALSVETLRRLFSMLRTVSSLSITSTSWMFAMVSADTLPTSPAPTMMTFMVRYWDDVVQ